MCLPYAGGMAAAYRFWAATLPPYVQLFGVELPGHGTRAATPPEERPERIVRRISLEVAPLAAASPLVLFGHGTGALLAYEVARSLSARGTPPSALVVSALCPADRLDRKANGVLAERKDLLQAHLARLGQPPLEVCASPGTDGAELQAAQLRAARADLRILAGAPAPAAPLDVPVLALAGRHDISCPPHLMAHWQRHTRRWLGLQIMPGDHFFPWEDDEVPWLLGNIATTPPGNHAVTPDSLLAGVAT
ncbi:thioesterase II family protein [Streptomyces sp. NPDC006463]|uniref:thioesterase II family protein n=1 Tax=Streptomyces sp. NPDC006463 TaxID=3364746 RepID=UPI00367F929A